MKPQYVFLTAIYLCATSLSRAQEQSPPEKQAAPAAGQEKSALSRTSSAAAPLTIDQIRANLPATPADRFEFLRRQRKITLEALDESSSQLKSLTASISLAQKVKDTLEEQQDKEFFLSESKEDVQNALQRAKKELADAQQKLTTAKSKRGVTSNELTPFEDAVKKSEEYVSKIEDYERRQKQEEKKKQEAEAALKAATEKLSKLNDERDKVAQAQISFQRLLGEIDDMVNQLFISSDATNSFKLRMSIAFSILVGVVIIGFFYIAWSDENVKRTIFSNEAGIQFITMFAIVIAVILFGIIGVLESKELSALLGGLSGYILGKSKERTTP
jgi:DNA repair exonuclease SbcCD ATPase subunit